MDAHRRRAFAFALTVPLVLTACFAPADRSAAPTPGPSVLLSGHPGESGASDGHTFVLCPNQTWPPHGSKDTILGLSIRVLDRGRFEIANSSRMTYYFDTFVWTEEPLECGRGLTDGHMQGGVLVPGASVEIPAGSRKDAPVTVSIWDAPCGLGCYRPPIGLFVVPESSIEPSPMLT